MAKKDNTIQFPSGASRVWSQQNVSDTVRADPSSGLVGNLYSSFNIDLVERDGKIRVGKRMIVNTNSNDVAQLVGSPVGFRIANSGKVYTAAGFNGTGYVFNTSGPSGSNLDLAFSKNVVAGGATAPSTIDSFYSDIDLFYDQIFVTTPSSTAYFLNAAETAWTTINIFGDSTTDTNVHMLASFGQRMYCTYGGNGIVSWDMTGSSTTPANYSNKTGTGSLIIGDSTNTSRIIWMRAASDRMWIGTLNTNGGKGYVYTWDGESSLVTAAYRLQSSGALSCVIKDDIPYIIDTYGRLSKWNGGTFVQIAQFNMLNNLFLYNAMGVNNSRFIHPNGMSLLNGQVSALVDGRNYDGGFGPPPTFTQLNAIPSGVWQYDPLYGWFHKHSLGISHKTDTIIDYGQIYPNSTGTVAAVGGLSELISSFMNGSGQNGSFLAGGTYTTDFSSSGALQSAIFYDDNNDTLKKAAYFITAKIPSGDVTDIWQKVFIAHKPLLNSSDRYAVKYRTVESPSSIIVVTCPTTSTLSSTDANVANFVIGDEVEFTGGRNSGICAHITNISNSSGTYTVTLDETITGDGSGATSRVRFQKWVKIKEVNDQTSMFSESGINATASTWVQFKVWILCAGANEIETLSVVSKPSQEMQ